MKHIYPAIFHNAEEGGYTVTFPDLKGCITEGDDLQEAFSMAEEVLSSFLSSLIDRDMDIPKPSDIAKIKVKDGFCNYVTGYPEKFITRNKAVKKTLSIPEWLNDAAEKKHVNFSSVLKDALIEIV